jgi:acyl-homoserine-lactone acylase
MVYTRGRNGKLTPFVGDTYILAVEFTDPPTAYSVMVYSESSEPDSKHLADQTELYARKQMKRAWFSEEDIQKNLERTYKPGE